MIYDSKYFHEIIITSYIIKVCISHPAVQAPVILEKRYPKMNAKMLHLYFSQIRVQLCKSVAGVVALTDHGDKCQ